MRSIPLDGQFWTLRTSPLRLRYRGEDVDLIVDRPRKDILICTADGPDATADRIAEAVEIISRPPAPQQQTAPAADASTRQRPRKAV